MSRLATLLFLLVVLLLLFPPVRAELRPYAQPLFDPLYEYNARNRVKTLVGYLREQESLGRPLPAPRDFAQFVEQRDFQENASLDPWGNPYYLRMNRSGYFVGSTGRDKVQGTTDDIVSETVPRRDGGRRRAGQR